MKKKLVIDARIDLHGLTQDKAYVALQRFFSSSRLNQKKTLLVITGKGTSEKPCAMKVILPRWLQFTDLKQHVQSYSEAPIGLGGTGATIVMLKKSSVVSI